MSDLSVDQLTLRITGYTEEQGRALAGLVGEALAGMVLPRAGRIERVEVTMPAQPAETEGSLSQRIAGSLAAEIQRALR